MTWITVQSILVKVFNAALAGVLGTGVASRIQTIQIGIRYRTHVADDVSDELPFRVAPHQARLKIDPGKIRPVNSEGRNFLVAHAKTQGHRFETRASLRQRHDARNLLSFEQAKARQAIQRVFNVRDLLGDQLELIGRNVFREHIAIAVEDQAAVGRHGFDANPVALRLFFKLLVEYDLQLHQAGDDHAEQ